VERNELLSYVKNLNESFPIDHSTEFKLAKQILKFSDCILMVLDSLLLNQVGKFIFTSLCIVIDLRLRLQFVHNV